MWFNYILFLVLVKVTFKEYFHLYTMYKIMEGFVSFPTPVFLFGTAFFSWRFCLVAVNSMKCLHLCVLYAVLLQNLQNFFQCIFVWLFASICHINLRCNQIIGRCKIENSLLWNCLNCDWWKFLMFLTFKHPPPPGSPLSIYSLSFL